MRPHRLKAILTLQVLNLQPLFMNIFLVEAPAFVSTAPNIPSLIGWLGSEIHILVFPIVVVRIVEVLFDINCGQDRHVGSRRPAWVRSW
jgi:hypothetical protein